jgi:hypothetical protein
MELSLAEAASAILGGALVICTILEAIELVQMLSHRSSTFSELPSNREEQLPFVSLHVPVCAEPPAVVERTLRALAALDYPEFEVVVVSNNTSDPTLWQPVEQMCGTLGERFRFFHLPTISGYKAGALNFSLRQTSHKAKLIGIIDSDYVVEVNFLQHLAPAFSDQRIGFVQSPQDYREWEDCQFSRMCYWEYWQFFAVGMHVRAAYNAIMLHGTMSLIRKSAITQAGGWAEWCLTEDSELGIRLLASGWNTLYIKRSFGRGLVPFSLTDYKRQRRRWVVGGVQQFQRHSKLLLWSGQMDVAQRFLQLLGWVPWLRDAIVVTSLPFAGAIAVLGVARVADPESLTFLTIGLVAVLAHHVVRQITVGRVLLGLGWRDTVAAAIAIVGLTWTIGVSWVAGSVGYQGGFIRTPKEADCTQENKGEARLETAIGIVMAALGAVLLARCNAAQFCGCLAPMALSALLLPAAILDWASKMQRGRT